MPHETVNEGIPTITEHVGRSWEWQPSYSVLLYPCKSWPPNPVFKCNPEGFRNIGCPARERKRERTENVIHLATRPHTDPQLETKRVCVGGNFLWSLSFYLLNWRGNFSYWMETALGSESDWGTFSYQSAWQRQDLPRVHPEGVGSKHSDGEQEKYTCFLSPYCWVSLSQG